MPMKTQKGWKILAVVKGENLEIDIRDSSLQAIKAADGDTCICERTKEKFWVPDEE